MYLMIYMHIEYVKYPNVEPFQRLQSHCFTLWSGQHNL